MQEKESNILEMGLMNIADVLLNLYNETLESKNVLESIHKTLIENFKKFHQKPNKTTADLSKQHDSFFKGFKRNFQGMFESSRTARGNGIASNVTQNSGQTININIAELPTEKQFKSGAVFFEKLNRLLIFGKDKFDNITDFFTDLNSNLAKLNPLLNSAGLGIGFLALGLLALNAVSLLSLMKLVVVLPMVGTAFALFVNLLTKAVSGIGFFKAFIVLHQLPAIFIAMGKAVLFLSIGLLIFEKVGWDSMMKMGASMLFLSVVFSKYISNGQFVDFAVLISLGVAIYMLAGSLKNLENIQWETLAKFGVFIMGLSMALSLYRGGVKGDGNTLALVGLSIALVAISYALKGAETISWTGVLMLNTFIIGLGLAMKISGFGGVGAGSNMLPLLMLSVGVVAISYALNLLQTVDIADIFKVITVITILGLAINKIVGKGSMKLGGISQMGQGNTTFGVLKFAFGLAIMALAMYALADVPLSAMFKTIGFIVALGFALRAFNSTSKYSGLSGFAFGLGLMVLAILAMDELPFSAMATTIGFIVLLGLSLRIFNGRGNSLWQFSLAFGMLVLALYAVDELPLSAMFTTLAFLGSLAVIMKFFTPVAIGSLLATAGAIVAMGFAFKLIGNTNIDGQKLAMFGIFVVGFGAILALLGVPVVAGLVGLGAVVMLGIAVTALAISFAIKTISSMKFDYNNVWDFMESAGVLAIGFAIIAIPAMIGIAGALLFIPIALASLLGAEALRLLSRDKYDTENVDNFMKGVSILSLGFAKYSLAIMVGSLPALAFIPIALSAFLGALVLAKISKVEVNENRINRFSEGVQLIIKMYDKFGVIQMTKNGLKSVALLPILGATYLSALVLEKINKLDISRSRIASFGETFESLITVMSDTISNQKDKLKDIQPALKSVTEIVNISSKLAMVVQQMADMKFNEYAVKDGKLVLVGQRVLNEDDFRRVGQNIGILVSTLLDPLTALGDSNSSGFMIGNRVIANPFKSNKHLKGLDMIKRMGDAYLPLTQSIEKMANSEMYDTQKATLISSSMMMFIFSYARIFEELETKKYTNATKSIDEIVRFNDLINSLDKNKSFEGFVKIGGDFIEKFGDEIKWRTIKSNITFMRTEVEKMVKSINTLDMKKAKFFEANLKLLVEQKSSKQLAEILELLKDLLGLAVEHQSGYYDTRADLTGDTVNYPTQNTPQNNTPSVQNTPVNTDNSDRINQALLEKMDEFNTLLSALNQKVGGVLKVKNVSNLNSI